ncbi:MAG: hypothetical protein IT564_06455 [Rhodospirillales bacterium]|nr:hypothetical protein [Rhodospirillales bacterium]
MLKRTLLAAAAAVLISSPAFASECPKLMKAYDEAAKMNPSKATADAKKLRADGEADHKAGKHADSVAKLKKAMAMVGAK